MKDNDTKKESGLKDYGIIFLSGDISDQTAESACREIVEYNLEGNLAHIQLIMNSRGGSCSAGFAIIDIIEWSKIPVYTTGIGMIASMGLLVFVSGAKGHRVITPRTSILSHRFLALAEGNYSQLIAGRKEEDLLHERIVQHYLRHTRVSSREELEKHLLRDVDTWLTPEEAVRYGVADVVESLGPAPAKEGSRL
jgi:ATP-dependent Clp protease protease subunit